MSLFIKASFLKKFLWCYPCFSMHAFLHLWVCFQTGLSFQTYYSSLTSCFSFPFEFCVSLYFSISVSHLFISLFSFLFPFCFIPFLSEIYLALLWNLMNNEFLLLPPPIQNNNLASSPNSSLNLCCFGTCSNRSEVMRPTDFVPGSFEFIITQSECASFTSYTSLF